MTPEQEFVSRIEFDLWVEEVRELRREVKALGADVRSLSAGVDRLVEHVAALSAQLEQGTPEFQKFRQQFMYGLYAIAGGISILTAQAIGLWDLIAHILGVT